MFCEEEVCELFGLRDQRRHALLHAGGLVARPRVQLIQEAPFGLLEALELQSVPIDLIATALAAVVRKGAELSPLVAGKGPTPSFGIADIYN